MKLNEQQVREGLQRRAERFVPPTRLFTERYWDKLDAKQPHTARGWRLTVAITTGVVAVAILVPTVVASLGQDRPPTAETQAVEHSRHPSDPPAPSLNVGNQEEGGDMMQALMVGTLTESNGCVVVRAGDQDVQILWPRGYTARSDGADTRLFDADGRARATVGDQVRLTGGFVHASDYGWTTDALRCEHQGIRSYFVVGLVQG